MSSFPKTTNYRNKRILELAGECDHCMWCGGGSKGWIIAAHCNCIEFGSGKGIKASDIPVSYLCSHCHELVDNPPASSHLSRMDRELLFFKSSAKTLCWLANEGHLEIK